MNSFLADLKKDVQCSLCNDTLIEPKILPCFHTFCKLCIKRHAELIEEVNVFKCPECKTETSLPELSSVEDLKPSLLHSRMVKVLEFVQSEKVCSVSGSHSPASWHCFDCDRSLCDECEKNHSEFIKDHKVVSLVEIKEEDMKKILSREANCANHGGKAVELFCKDCELVICMECLKDKHEGHSSITLLSYVRKKKSLLCDKLKRLKIHEQKLGNQFKEMEEDNNTFKKSCEKAKEDVKKNLEEIIQILRKNAKKLIDQIDHNIETAEKQKAKGQSVLDHTRGAIEYLNTLIEKGFASEVTGELQDSIDKVMVEDQMKETELGLMSFTFNMELVKQVSSGLGNLRKLEQIRSVEVEGEVEALKKAKLVVLTNKRSDVVDVEIKPEDNARIGKKSVYTSEGKIEIEFMAKVAGPLTAEVQVNGNHVSNSPLVMNVKPQRMRITRKFNMKGLNTLPKNVTGIAVNKENSRIAVANQSSHCVQVFNTDGNLLLTYGGQGSGQGQLNTPRGLEFVNETDLAIADSWNHRICIVNTTTGTLVKIFGNQGNRNGQFFNPNGVHVDDDGNIIVCDYSNHRVQVFTRDGDYQYQFGLTEQDNFGPISAVSFSGRFYVSDLDNHVIHVFEKIDGVPTRISTIGEKGEADGQFRRVWGLAIDNDHHLLVCDGGNNRIQKFTLDGKFVGKTSGKPNNPFYVTVLSDGQVVVTSFEGSVFYVE